jgi:hypothetical protein
VRDPRRYIRGGDGRLRFDAKKGGLCLLILLLLLPIGVVLTHQSVTGRRQRWCAAVHHEIWAVEGSHVLIYLLFLFDP